MVSNIILSQYIAAVLLSISLFISAIKKQPITSVAIIIIGLAFFILVRSL